MRYRLLQAKDSPDNVIVLPSHPYLRPCNACGVEYASPDQEGKKVPRDPGEEDELYCISCQNKRDRDVNVKEWIDNSVKGTEPVHDEYLWVQLIDRIRKKEYKIPPRTERPHDFNVFRNFKGNKDYFGLIYADANNMGRKVEANQTLAGLNDFARIVDQSIYKAVCLAIVKHLKIGDHIKPKNELVDNLENDLFPFDILLLGGDDVIIVVPASVAMDVALTIANEFRRLTIEGDPEGNGHTLSVGVVLAPVKYPYA